MARSMTPLEDRFMRYVRMGRDYEDCWIWTGAIVPTTGYGQIGLGSRQAGTANAHRVSYELFCESIPDGLCVLHRCDNRRCVHPYHLFLGTKSDNNRDMGRKGRWRNGTSAGRFYANA